jgi:AcrR family transcriptional regulator
MSDPTPQVVSLPTGGAQPDSPRRAELLREVRAWMVENGVADLSLRRIAADLGTSSRMLIYYFGSKEALIAEAFSSTLREEMATFDVPTSVQDLSAGITWMWQALSSPSNEPDFRLFFEVVGLAMNHPDRYGSFAETLVRSWVLWAERWLVDVGVEPERAGVLATLVVGTVRGVAMDLLSTGDRRRADGAIAVLAEQVQTLTSQPASRIRLARGSRRS